MITSQKLESAEFNAKLYKPESVVNETFVLKEEIFEVLSENVSLDVESYYEKPIRSRDYHDPGDAGDIHLSAEGFIELESLISKYGELHEADKDYILENLSEDEGFKDTLHSILSDEKHPVIQSFSVRSFLFFSKGKMMVEVECDDIEIDDNNYGDY